MQPVNESVNKITKEIQLLIMLFISYQQATESSGSEVAHPSQISLRGIFLRLKKHVLLETLSFLDSENPH